MASKFQIKVFNGSNPQAQYDSLIKKDPLTLYLLSTGIVYFGEVPLFGGGGSQDSIVIINDILKNPVKDKLYILYNATYGEETLTGLYFYNQNKLESYSDELFTNYITNILVTENINDGNESGRNTEQPSKEKIITENALVRYIFDIIMPFVKTYIKDTIGENVVTFTVDSMSHEVTINGTNYQNLEKAIADVEVNGIITLTQDTGSDGVSVPSNTNFTIDLNGNTLSMIGNTGSAGTQTNALQLLKDSDITIKNGTIISESAKILIQNYSNLTLDNVKVIGSGINEYLVSNNFGNIIFKNGTQIIAKDKQIAFDLYYGMSSAYDDGITVTIADDTVVIEGPIEYGKATRANESDFETKCKLITPAGYSLNIPNEYEWKNNGNGTQTLIKKVS